MAWPRADRIGSAAVRAGSLGRRAGTAVALGRSIPAGAAAPGIRRHVAGTAAATTAAVEAAAPPTPSAADVDVGPGVGSVAAGPDGDCRVIGRHLPCLA